MASKEIRIQVKNSWYQFTNELKVQKKYKPLYLSEMQAVAEKWAAGYNGITPEFVEARKRFLEKKISQSQRMSKLQTEHKVEKYIKNKIPIRLPTSLIATLNVKPVPLINGRVAQPNLISVYFKIADTEPVKPPLTKKKGLITFKLKPKTALYIGPLGISGQLTDNSCVLHYDSSTGLYSYVVIGDQGTTVLASGNLEIQIGKLPKKPIKVTLSEGFENIIRFLSNKRYEFIDMVNLKLHPRRD